VPVLFVISFTVFAIVRLAPGDPVDTILGQRYDPEVADRLREKYGYDDPIVVQYFKYIRNLAQLELGESTQYTNFTVSEVIWPKLKVSAALGVIALFITFAVGIPVGVYAALARGTFLDPMTIGFWLAIDAVPTFVAIPILQWVFALRLGWVDVGYDGLTSPNIILPIVVMSLPGVAGVARLMRASIIGVMGEDHVRTARAMGLKESTVVIHYITRNALLPMVTVVGLSLPGIAGGALFVETMFGIPGIARASLQAVTGPDYDVILALVLMGSTLFVMANIVTDIAYAFVDPRIKVGGARG
jgi:ABC-type dipeptide/oligopeptide/nickel transport system permease component